MLWFQKEITLPRRGRGFHIITDDVLDAVPEIRRIRTGLAHIFIKHTSASLTLNENADPDVRTDLETHFTRTVPEDASYYLHTLEGRDDMTSHIKSVTIGSSVSIPITNGRFNLGTWQGIFLCEHRNAPHRRSIVVTIAGTDT